MALAAISGTSVVSLSIERHPEDITRCSVTCLRRQLISLQVPMEPATLLASLQNGRMTISIEQYSACGRCYDAEKKSIKYRI